MTIIYAAATLPVNPPGATPIITQDQLWAGLERKRGEPQLFIPVIDTCVVLENDGETVLREVKFKDGMGGGQVVAPTVQERITHIKPITSTAGSGLETFATVGSASRVLNIVSTGEKESDLYLTFTFEWDHPEIEAGSEVAAAKQKGYQTMAPRGVSGTLAQIRKMVAEGQL